MRYIVWKYNGGYEGWSPEYLDTQEEVIEFIKEGYNYGKIIVTREVAIVLKEE